LNIVDPYVKEVEHCTVNIQVLGFNPELLPGFVGYVSPGSKEIKSSEVFVMIIK